MHLLRANILRDFVGVRVALLQNLLFWLWELLLSLMSCSACGLGNWAMRQQTFKIELAHVRGGGIWEELGVRFMRLLHSRSYPWQRDVRDLVCSLLSFYILSNLTWKGAVKSSLIQESKFNLESHKSPTCAQVLPEMFASWVTGQISDLSDLHLHRQLLNCSFSARHLINVINVCMCVCMWACIQICNKCVCVCVHLSMCSDMCIFRHRQIFLWFYLTVQPWLISTCERQMLCPPFVPHKPSMIGRMTLQKYFSET